MADREIALNGGNVTPVVRIGDAVHRVAGPWTPAVHDLLRYLHARGFSGAPRPLGFDSQGREMLTFIEGDIGSYPLPAHPGSDASLVEVAHLLRRYHDVTSEYVPPHDVRWQLVYPDSSRHEVICHNDLAPYNVVYRDGRPHALIDFDMAGPGPRVWDLAHAAYRFVPLVHMENAEIRAAGLAEPVAQGRRLQMFCAAYGISTRDVLDMVEPRLQALCATIIESAAAGHAAFQRHIDDGHLDFYRREITRFRRMRPRLEGC